MTQPNKFHERGIIKKISLRDFVTYDTIEVYPGKNLNLVIGPNGTGKSTLVSGIILGLGGRPKTLGRGNTLSTYVKSGKATAKIEITLKKSATEDVVIGRSFDNFNMQQWYLNGTKVTLKEINEVINSFNIQVENLCQFLPQDKVQDFSKMNNQQLLENTERSVGEPELIALHAELINLRKVCSQAEAEIEQMKKKLESKQHTCEEMKNTVESINEKKSIQNKISMLKAKRAWITYTETKDRYMEAKQERDAAANQLKEIDDKLGPIKVEIKKYEKKIEKLTNGYNKSNTVILQKVNSLTGTKNNIDQFGTRVHAIDVEFRAKIAAQEDQKKLIAEEEDKREKYANDLESVIATEGTEEAMKKKDAEFIRQIDTRRAEMNKRNSQLARASRVTEPLTYDLNELQRDLSRTGDVRRKKEDLLRNKNSDAYRAMQWLSQNRGKFQGVIHDPVMMNFEVKNEKYTKYFESVIGQRDLFAFVCEDTTTMNQFLKAVRDGQGLKINAIHQDPNRRVSFDPKVPLDSIKSLGFQHYLVSLFDAPETVKKFLISNYHLHNIPIGDSSVDNNVNRVPQHITKFMSTEIQYNIRYSKYTGDRSTSQTKIHGNGLLSIVVDRDRIRVLTETIEAKRMQIDEANADVPRLKEEIIEDERVLSELRGRRGAVREALDSMKTIKTRMAMAERKIAELQVDVKSVEEIMDDKDRSIEQAIKKIIREFLNYNDCSEANFQEIFKHETIKAELTQIENLRDAKQNDSKNLEEECKEATRKWKTLNVELKPLGDQVKELFTKAKSGTENVTPDDRGWNKFQQKFDKFPGTLIELSERIKIEQSKMYCMTTASGENTSDPEKVKDYLRTYDTLRMGIEKLGSDIGKGTEFLALRKSEMSDKRSEWLDTVNGLVGKINNNFSTYFANMKCAGEVALVYDENDEFNFEKYGLKILVKFRDSDELQEFTRTRQSGGERAVTTAIYMIALQELSKVPFRCIDEINQGMDAANERRIFDLLGRITAETNSQYFLITPKLLSDLNYAETVTVHCVYNGPENRVPNQREFDMSTHTKRLSSLLDD